MREKLAELEQEYGVGNENPDEGEPELVPVHMSKEEIKYLNILQGRYLGMDAGEQLIDEETGLRMYPVMSQIIRIPEVRDLFIYLSQHLLDTGNIPHDILSKADILEKDFKGYKVKPIPSDHDPEVTFLSKFGGTEDKYLVLLPADVANFLDILDGPKDKESPLGLNKFGFFRKVFKVVAPILGAVAGSFFGAPHLGALLGSSGAGAAAGSALGSLAGSALSHNKPLVGLKEGIPQALLSGAAAWGLNSSGSSGSSLGSLFGNGERYFGSATNNAGVAGAMARSTPVGGTPWLEAASKQGSGGLWDSLKSNALPAALIAGGLFSAHKGEKEELKEHEKNRAATADQIKALRDYYKFDDPLRETLAYKKGGRVGEPIKGPGKGQDDLIRKTLKEGDWVWDASVSSDLGDGSTKAGHDSIKKFELIFSRKSPKLKDHKVRTVPCALSDGEYVTPRRVVTAIGGGSNERGAEILRQITKAVRKHKISKGADLPPSAYDLMTYYKKVI